MQFKLYRPASLGADLWQAFTDLRNARAIYDDPFFDPEFARIVGEVREDVRIGVAFNNDTPIGFWPLHARPGGWSRPIGGPFSDWHGPVLAKDTLLIAAEFLNGLGLAGMTTFGLMPQDFDSQAGFERVGANMTDLSEGWDSYIDNQQKCWPKHFKKMRRLYRNVDRDFETHTFNWDDKTDVSFERLLTLKQEQFARTGYHDVLKPKWARDLLDRLRHHESPRLRVRLVTLFYDDQHAASELNLQSDKVMHGWLTGYNMELGNYSPGNMLVQEMLERMCEHGIRTYDAGPGLDHYKRHYSNYQLPIDSGPLRGSRGSLAPSRIAGRAWRWGEGTLPLKVSNLMGRARRRMDQISLAETTSAARMAGVIGALSQRDL